MYKHTLIVNYIIKRRAENTGAEMGIFQTVYL